MPHAFYGSTEYRLKQSALTRENWKKGKFNFLFRKEKRTCVRKGCSKKFEVIPSYSNIYCGHSCAAKVNNVRRGPYSKEVREKIARALTGKTHPNRKRKYSAGLAQISIICASAGCRKIFSIERWMKRKFCSN
jgi:hypothetical protein